MKMTIIYNMNKCKIKSEKLDTVDIHFSIDISNLTKIGKKGSAYKDQYKIFFISK